MGSQKSIKKRSIIAEKDSADKLGGRVVPASGAGRQKGDIKLEHFLLDQKATEANSFLVDKKHLVKIDLEATNTNRFPAMVYKFDQIASGVEREWVLIPLTVFTRLLDEFTKNN